jgi:hypothetical protein
MCPHLDLLLLVCLTAKASSMCFLPKKTKAMVATCKLKWSLTVLVCARTMLQLPKSLCGTPPRGRFLRSEALGPREIISFLPHCFIFMFRQPSTILFKATGLRVGFSFTLRNILNRQISFRSARCFLFSISGHSAAAETAIFRREERGVISNLCSFPASR